MAARRLDDLDYYALLKVPREATIDDIRQAFHAFARKYHPDQVAHNPALSVRHTRIYQRGTEAYRVLTHPDQRRIYDEGLASGQLRFDPDMTPPGGHAGSGRGAGGAAGAAKARPFLARARQAMRTGDHRAARLHLRIALGHDPDDPELQRLLDQVEAELDA